MLFNVLQVSHGNTAAHAAELGDKQLGKICAAIAGDEARHEKAYIKIVDKLFELCVSPCFLVSPTACVFIQASALVLGLKILSCMGSNWTMLRGNQANMLQMHRLWRYVLEHVICSAKCRES